MKEHFSIGGLQVTGVSAGQMVGSSRGGREKENGLTASIM